jgi:16S rRNA (guanine527-N7)-methyltransferase
MNEKILNNPLEPLLSKGLQSLNLDASSEQKEKLLLLLEQLIKWNKTYNLTAIKNPKEVLTLHFLDSLAVTPFIKQTHLLDVGTGAGFPGLPLAIMLPKSQFTLLDSNSKKIRFIRQQIHLLDLKNVDVIHSRVEVPQDKLYEGIISRAFASVEDMVNLTQHLLANNGVWLAMKGQYNEQEIKDLSEKIVEVTHHTLDIPNLFAERCLIELKPA